MVIQLPLLIAVSTRRFWTRPPEIRFLLFDKDKHPSAIVDATVDWDYDAPSNLRPFISATLVARHENGGCKEEPLFASVEKEGATPVFLKGKDVVGKSEWGAFLTTSAIHDANGGLIAKMKGWPFSLSRKVYSADGGVVARFHCCRLLNGNEDFLKGFEMKRCFVLDSGGRQAFVNSLIVADWICMVAAAYGTKPYAGL